MNDQELKNHVLNVRQIIMHASTTPADNDGRQLALGMALGCIDLLANRLRLTLTQEGHPHDRPIL